MPAKPSTLPEWNSGGANRTTPPGGKLVLGYVFGEEPSSAYDNYWQNLVYQWIQYLNAPLGVTTTPAITATAGTGGGSIAFRGVAGDNSSVPIVGVAGGVSGPTESAFVSSSFPGSGVMGLTGVSGLPGVIGANVATGPGVLGTNGGSGGTGVQGTGTAVGTFGGVFSGNAASTTSLLADAITSALGAGVVGGATGSTVAAYFKQYGTTRGTLQAAAQATPSAPATGDVWIDSSAANLLSHYDGTTTRRAAWVFGQTTASANLTLSGTYTAFSNGTVTIPAGVLKVGSIIEVDFLISFPFSTNATGGGFGVQVRMGSSSGGSNDQAIDANYISTPASGANSQFAFANAASQQIFIRGRVVCVIAAVGAAGGSNFKTGFEMDWGTGLAVTRNMFIASPTFPGFGSSATNSTFPIAIMMHTNGSPSFTSHTPTLQMVHVRVSN